MKLDDPGAAAVADALASAPLGAMVLRPPESYCRVDTEEDLRCT